MKVGQTKKTLWLIIHLACEISWAIQYTARIDKSELIIAINNDEDALIFGPDDLVFIHIVYLTGCIINLGGFFSIYFF